MSCLAASHSPSRTTSSGHVRRLSENTRFYPPSRLPTILKSRTLPDCLTSTWIKWSLSRSELPSKTSNVTPPPQMWICKRFSKLNTTLLSQRQTPTGDCAFLSIQQMIAYLPQHLYSTMPSAMEAQARPSIKPSCGPCAQHQQTKPSR